MSLISDPSIQPVRNGAKISWWLTSLGISVALAMMALGSIALLASRNDLWKRAEQSAGNLLLALDRDIGRNITILDLSLSGLIDAMAEPGIDQASPGVRHHALFDRSATAEDLGSLLVLDANGDVVEDSTSLVPHKLKLGDRDYFQVHQRDPDVGLYISRAFKSRIGDGDLRFAISRRIPDRAGKFVGVVSATLRLNYFRRLFEKLEVGQQGSISLLRTDGRILVRYPFREEDVDLDLGRAGTNSARLLKARSGQYVATSPVDGVERLFTFRRIGDLPLVLAVNLSTDEIYAPWWHKAMVILPTMILLCAAAVTSSVLFRREMMRRETTERALAAAAQQLSVLAATDGLTGLLNRRTFDLEFDRAFRRAIRQGTSVAVLMLDADLFKRFNDTYGHPAGDDVLRSIAACMERHLKRPDDIKARYGGEEFVAILPDTSLDAAHRMGDRIRIAVEELRIEHAASPVGHVTVSIGVATMTPMAGSVAGELLQLADEALYAAKRDGRNCVHSAAAPGGYNADLCFGQLVGHRNSPPSDPGLQGAEPTGRAGPT